MLVINVNKYTFKFLLNFSAVFQNQYLKMVQMSEDEPSLHELVQVYKIIFDRSAE